ncbi:phage tail tape measure protein [Aquimarina aggregata]|uniref:phage tail tape measure protein n=1 Tax=Aquimarina aggregata TaxID=1642818 RepID=UPI002493C1EA|nr:phage tail tape measure protein [Aquimarina aggregata]
MSNRNPQLRFKITINGKEIKNTLNGVRAHMNKVKGQLGGLVRGTEKYNEKSQELRKVTKIFNEMQQEIKGVPSLLQKLKKELGLVGLSIASIFTVHSMVSYFKVLKEKVEVLKKLKRTISQITELEGRELELVTSKVKAMADAFDEDSKKMTEAANNLSKQMGIDFSAALDLIKDGYNEGANANGDFLDKVREYPALLREAGLSAQESINLMSQEVKKGIYSDKGVDAIKEANLRLREMTPAASAAIDGIGLSSKAIEKDLATGSKTTFEVVQEISKRLATLPPQSKLAGQAIADIFGGAGEDAGIQYLSTLHEIDLSLSNVTASTGKYAEAKNLEVEANESLNNVWVQLTDTAGTLNLVWNKMKLQLAFTVSFLAKLIGISDEADGTIVKLRQKIVTITKILIIAATAVLSYNAAVKLMAYWSRIGTVQTILHTLAVKANAVGMAIAKVAALAYTVVVALLSGNLKKATIAMRAFSIATKLNPIGLLIAAIMAAVVAYNLFAKSTDKAANRQRALNELKKKSSSIFGEEEAKLKKLLLVAKNENVSKEKRIAAIEKLNALSPRYLGNLTLENINTREATSAIGKHIEAMKKRAEQKALEQLIDETIKKRREESSKSLVDEVTWYEGLGVLLKNFGDTASATADLQELATDRRKENLDELSDREAVFLEEYKKNLEEQGNANDKQLENDKKFQKIRANLEATALKLKIKNIEEKSNAQLRLEIQKAIERNNELAKLNKEAAEKAAEELKKRLEKERIFRDKILLEGKSSILQEIEGHKKRLKEAGIYGKSREKLTESQLRVLEILEQRHKTNIVKIENEAINVSITKLKSQFEKATILRKTSHNDEIAELQSIEEAKAILRITMTDKELSKIKTLQDAKKALHRNFELEELTHQADFLNKQIELMNSVLNGEDTGINLADKLLTEEQKEILQQRIEEVKLKLSEIGVIKNEEEGEDTEIDTLDGAVDIFGFTIDDWEKTFENLDTAKEKIKAVELVVGGLQNVWGMYNDFLSANEEKSLSKFKKSNKEKKESLKSQLDSGIIDQETYSKEVGKLDDGLAKKKAEIEFKQAKREKLGALFGIAANTALGIAKSVAASPLTGGMPWSAVVASIGALQAGLVLTKPLPDKNNYAKGGYTKGLGYFDETGHEAAGAVHANEYVIPEFVLNSTDPVIPWIMDYVENSRKMKLGSFADGGFTSTPLPKFTKESQDTTDIEESNSSDVMIELTEVLRRLVEEGVMAKSLIGDDEIQRFDERLKKIEASRNNAKRQ